MNSPIKAALFVALLVLMPAVHGLSVAAAENPRLGQPYSNPETAVDCWGSNTWEHLNVPPELRHAASLAIGFQHVVALRSDGTLQVWGNAPAETLRFPEHLGRIIRITAGHYHTAALRADGTVVCWGQNSSGELGAPVDLAGVKEIAANGCHTLALRDDGSVVAWWCNSHGQTQVPSRIKDAIAIAAGVGHSMALQSDGTVVAWGYNVFGQCDVPNGLPRVTAIACGESHSLALTTEGKVVAWGWNASVPNGLSNVVAIAAGSEGHSLALRRDGSVVEWGSTFLRTVPKPAGITGGVAVFEGPFQSFVIRKLDTVPMPRPLAIKPKQVVVTASLPIRRLYQLESSLDGRNWMRIGREFFASEPQRSWDLDATETGIGFRLVERGPVLTWGEASAWAEASWINYIPRPAIENFKAPFTAGRRDIASISEGAHHFLPSRPGAGFWLGEATLRARQMCRLR